MAPIRQISDRQLEMIVEFAEANRAIVLGNGGKGPLGQKEANKAWEELARRLNSIGGGVIKTPNNWKRYWHLLKCRTKGKAADVRRSHVGTGDEPNRTIPLSDLEERIVSVIRTVAVERIPEVRVPFDLTQETQPSSSSNGLRTVETQPTCTSSTPASGLSLQASTAPASSIEIGLEYVGVEHEVMECAEVEVENSLSEPTSPASAPTDPCNHLAANRSSQASRRSPSPERNRDENLPDWIYDLEERRIAVEERMVNEIAGLGASNRAIVACLQQIVQLLQGHLSSSSK